MTIDRDPEEVVTVRPVTGSNIPKRVKVKDAISGDVARKSQTEEVDKDGFMRNLRPGRAVERDPGR